MLPELGDVGAGDPDLLQLLVLVENRTHGELVHVVFRSRDFEHFRVKAHVKKVEGADDAAVYAGDGVAALVVEVTSALRGAHGVQRAEQGDEEQ